MERDIIYHPQQHTDKSRLLFCQCLDVQHVSTHQHNPYITAASENHAVKVIDISKDGVSWHQVYELYENA